METLRPLGSFGLLGQLIPLQSFVMSTRVSLASLAPSSRANPAMSYPRPCFSGGSSPSENVLALRNNLPVAMSRSITYKKVTKPLLERRRRARMSKCLEEIKALMVGPMRISEENLNRLEKADILEMAVQYLHCLEAKNRHNRYQEGFNECAAEACHFLEKSPDCDESLSERLVEHLETCTGPLSIQVPSFRLTFSSPLSPDSSTHSVSPSCSQESSPGLLIEAPRRPTPFAVASPNISRRPGPYASSASSSHYHRQNRISNADQENVWRPW